MLLSTLAGVAHAAPPPNPMPAATVRHGSLGNGVTLVFRHDGSAPLVAVDLWVRAGTADDAGTGAAHALEHMAFRGSTGVPAGQADATAEAAGGTLFAATYADATHFWCAVPPTGLKTVMNALADLFKPPTVATDDWNRERRVILEEIDRAASDPMAVVRRSLAAKLFRPPFDGPATGTREAITALTPETIRAFHKSHYTPDRMILVVVGNVDSDSVSSTAAAAFGSIAPVSNKASVIAVPASAATFSEAETVSGGSVVVGRAYPALVADPAAVDVLTTILRTRLAREAAGAADSVEVVHPWQRAGMVAMLARGPAAMKSKLKSALEAAVAGSFNVTRAELADAVHDRVWSWWTDNESPIDQARTLGLAESLGVPDEATLNPERYEGITMDEVQQAARTVFGGKAG